MKRVAGCGHGCTRDLGEVIDKVGRCTRMGVSIQCGWVKAHVGIQANEGANLMATAGCRESLLPQIMEGGVHAMWKDRRSRERVSSGLGMAWVVCWNRRAALRYMHLPVVKGDLGQWRLVLGASEYLCRLCGTEEETGGHLVFRCERSSDLQPWVWVSWVQLDNKRRWRYTVEGDGGKIII